MVILYKIQLLYNTIIMGCNIEQVNWNISISWDCWNVTIGQIWAQLEWARNYDVKGDLDEDINAVSQYVKIYEIVKMIYIKRSYLITLNFIILLKIG